VSFASIDWLANTCIIADVVLIVVVVVVVLLLPLDPPYIYYLPTGLLPTTQTITILLIR